MSVFGVAPYVRGHRARIEIGDGFVLIRPASSALLRRIVAGAQRETANRSDVTRARFQLSVEREARWQALTRTPELRGACFFNRLLRGNDGFGLDADAVTDALISLELEGKRTVAEMTPALRDYQRSGLPSIGINSNTLELTKSL